VDFDAQKAADRVAELIAEGSMLARGWAERFARRLPDDARVDGTDPVDPPGPLPTEPPPAAAAATSAAPVPEGDPWSEACDPAADPDAGVDSAPIDEGGDADPAEDVEALTGALRATVARRLGVQERRVRVTVTLDDGAPTGETDGARSGVVDGVIVPTPMADRDPIDALTMSLDDLAARARTRLAEELGVRLPDIVAEIRFPAGGRPSVRIRPSARASSASASSTGAGTPDLEAMLRRLLLGRDGR